MEPRYSNAAAILLTLTQLNLEPAFTKATIMLLAAVYLEDAVMHSAPSNAWRLALMSLLLCYQCITLIPLSRRLGRFIRSIRKDSKKVIPVSVFMESGVRKEMLATKVWDDEGIPTWRATGEKERLPGPRSGVRGQQR